MFGAFGTHLQTRRIKRYVKAYEASLKRQIDVVRATTPDGHATATLARIHRTADQQGLQASGQLAATDHLHAAHLGLWLLAGAWGSDYLQLCGEIHDHLWRRSFVLAYSEAWEWLTAARNRGELDEPMAQLQWRAIGHAVVAAAVATRPLSYDEDFAGIRVARLKDEAVERVMQQHAAATTLSIERRSTDRPVAVEHERRLVATA